MKSFKKISTTSLAVIFTLSPIISQNAFAGRSKKSVAQKIKNFVVYPLAACASLAIPIAVVGCIKHRQNGQVRKGSSSNGNNNPSNIQNYEPRQQNSISKSNGNNNSPNIQNYEPEHQNSVSQSNGNNNSPNIQNYEPEHQNSVSQNYVPIYEIDISDYSEDNASIDLMELCEHFGVNQGQLIDGSYRTIDALVHVPMWQLSAYQYYFSSMRYAYSMMNPNAQNLLRQSIKFMRINMENPVYRDVMRTSLVRLSSHGGRHAFETTGNVETVYDLLIEATTSHTTGSDNQVPLDVNSDRQNDGSEPQNNVPIQPQQATSTEENYGLEHDATIRAQLGSKGRTYLKNNPINSIDVSRYSESDACHDLEAVCRHFGIIRGEYTGPKDSLTNMDVRKHVPVWQLSAWQYYFDSTLHRYSEMSPHDQILLRQCIKFMHTNKDNSDYSTEIYASLVQLSNHGGHCDARATDNFRAVYCGLLNVAMSHMRVVNSSQNINLNSTYETIFSTLKDKMYSYAINESRELAKTIGGGESASRVPHICNGIGRFLGIESSSLQVFGYTLYGNEVVQIGDIIKERILSCEYIIKTSYDVLKNSLEDDTRDNLLKQCDDTQLSFNEYCRYSAKTEANVQKFKGFINELNDDEFNAWVRGESKLSVSDIRYGIIAMISGDNATDAGCPEQPYFDGVRFLVLSVKGRYLAL